MAYDDRLIRSSLDRIAHALEAIARSKDSDFKTLAETKAGTNQKVSEKAVTDSVPRSAPQSATRPKTRGKTWIPPQKGWTKK